VDVLSEIEIRTVSAVGAALLLEDFGHITRDMTIEQVDAKLREVMGQELFWVGPAYFGDFALAYAGDGVWVRLEVPRREGHARPGLRPPVARRACSLTPNDGPGTEDFAPNH
jgi:hypothetical protein